jgi:hypothetical protein
MFGLFGKSEFNKEMEDLDKEYKILGNEMLNTMKSFDLQKQMLTLKAMAANCELKVQCCKKHGKLDEMKKWEAAKLQALQLHG